MQVEIVSTSQSWQNVFKQDDNSILAPNIMPFDEGFLCCVGLRRGNGPGKISLLSLNKDFSFSKVLSEDLFSIAGSAPWFANNGALPTSISIVNGKLEILFSGFSPFGDKFRILTGQLLLNPNLIEEVQSSSEPILEFSATDQLVGSASRDLTNLDSVFLSKGNKFIFVHGGWHPTSDIYVQNKDGSRDLLLSPSDNEYALTRPFHFSIGGKEYISFSRRLNDGRYLLGLATKSGNSWKRCDEDFKVTNSENKNFLYLAPTQKGLETYFAFTDNYLGRGLVYFGKVINN